MRYLVSTTARVSSDRGGEMSLMTSLVGGEGIQWRIFCAVNSRTSPSEELLYGRSAYNIPAKINIILRKRMNVLRLSISGNILKKTKYLRL
jgi:hypothetical protein